MAKTKHVLGGPCAQGKPNIFRKPKNVRGGKSCFEIAFSADASGSRGPYLVGRLEAPLEPHSQYAIPSMPIYKLASPLLLCYVKTL